MWMGLFKARLMVLADRDPPDRRPERARKPVLYRDSEQGLPAPDYISVVDGQANLRFASCRTVDKVLLGVYLLKGRAPDVRAYRICR